MPASCDAPDVPVVLLAEPGAVPAVAESRLAEPDVVLATPGPAGTGTAWGSDAAGSATCANAEGAITAIAITETLAPTRRDARAIARDDATPAMINP